MVSTALLLIDLVEALLVAGRARSVYDICARQKRRGHFLDERDTHGSPLPWPPPTHTLTRNMMVYFGISSGVLRPGQTYLILRLDCARFFSPLKKFLAKGQTEIRSCFHRLFWQLPSGHALHRYVLFASLWWCLQPHTVQRERRAFPFFTRYENDSGVPVRHQNQPSRHRYSLLTLLRRRVHITFFVLLLSRTEPNRTEPIFLRAIVSVPFAPRPSPGPGGGHRKTHQ